VFEDVDLAVSRVLPLPGSFPSPLLPRTPEFLFVQFPFEPWLSTGNTSHTTPNSRKSARSNRQVFSQLCDLRILRLWRNAGWSASWTVVSYPSRVSCTCSHVSIITLVLVSSQVGPQLIATRSDLDRTNLGNARLQGLAADVLGGDPTGKRFDWVNSSFFFSYVCPPHPPSFEIQSHLGSWLDFVSGSCYYPRQTLPPSAVVGLRSYRMGYLFDPHGWYPHVWGDEVRLISPFEITQRSPLRPIKLD
jgi:hypothetical protein